MLLATVMLFALAVGGTIAWLTDKDRPLVNTFDPSKVTCEVQEKFDGKVKSDVNVKNTGDIDAFIRVKLVTYRTNDAGQHIGGTAALPQFTLGANWVEYNGYYYYTLPVAPGDKPATKLTDSMTLTENYDDADGGHQSEARGTGTVPAGHGGRAGAAVGRRAVRAGRDAAGFRAEPDQDWAGAHHVL